MQHVVEPDTFSGEIVFRAQAQLVGESFADLSGHDVTDVRNYADGLLADRYYRVLGVGNISYESQRVVRAVLRRS